MDTEKTSQAQQAAVCTNVMPISLPPWPPRWPEIDAAARRCLQSGDWGNYHSDACRNLQRQLETFFSATNPDSSTGIGAPPTVRLCCSGTAAVEIALRAAGVGPGDEVIVAAMDYPGNFRSVELLGATPVLLDLADGSPCIDAHQVNCIVGERIRAVIASHLFGVAAEVADLRATCEQRGWTLIEDVCQTVGMRIGNQHAGTFGHLATLSFGGSKLITAGSGGAVLANDRRTAARLGPLMDRPSETFPLSPLQAAVIAPQLDRLDEMNRRRSENARFLRDQVMPRLPNWTWESGWTWKSGWDREGGTSRTDPAFYKVAFTATSSAHRQRILTTASEAQIPLGEGFRSMSRSSDRRCRKPVPCDRADRLGECLFVLDQRALLIESDQRDELADRLQSIHDQT